jgi:gamma-tubulin complex component 5
MLMGQMEVSESLINKLHSEFSGDLHFATPISSLRTSEVELVKGVLQILQGLSSSLFNWDQKGQCYRAKSGIYVTHLSQTSLHALLSKFSNAATNLQLVEILINRVSSPVRSAPPTLRALVSSSSAWLKLLRENALKEEVNICKSDGGTVPTLLGLDSSLSSVCAGAEYLLEIVRGAIPQSYFVLAPPVPSADIAVHILNYLYKKLNEVCHVQGGEEDAFRMLLYIFVGSVLPYIQCIDSWLFEGILDDPFEEVFFYANKDIEVDESEFWEKSYLLRSTQYENKGKQSVSGKGKVRTDRDLQVCPLFIKDIAKAIVSAGKSLQLIRHVPAQSSAIANTEKDFFSQNVGKLTLSEVFCVSLTALIGHGDHISKYFGQEDGISGSSVQSFVEKYALEENDEKIWCKFLVDTLHSGKETDLKSPYIDGFCAENPAITVCRRFLHDNSDSWNNLNLSRNFRLPPLNDEGLRDAIFGGNNKTSSLSEGTNYALGFQFNESEYLRSQEESKMLEVLFPFPTLLPLFQDNIQMSELLPFQKNSTLLSRVLKWIQHAEPKTTPLPVVIMQECLIVYAKKQVDKIGGHILSKLLNDWRLMDELGVLRTIYLLGSGDMMQHFLTVIFNKLDKGESWDDDFELNTVLQESIRNSADGMLLSAPDSLVVSITTKGHGSSSDDQHNTSPREKQTYGVDGLNSLKFTYKVPWPLELIANSEAIKKYNQVMNFLLKVKRAKFVLDKARRWMWKDRGSATTNRKRHWLVEQKLLHFVDAFHQYVMDRVYHSAWSELCEGMAAAGSLDEVIEVHEAYLLSIQKQCFVVPDKLWALIASRINSILGLALEFYSTQQTLSSGGAVSAIKARCEMEVGRIERQFDDCISFLLRVLSFKLNVGQFPHLADLVTRINYNYFYISNTGNVITAPGAGTAATSSKLGNSFLVQRGN